MFRIASLFGLVFVHRKRDVLLIHAFFTQLLKDHAAGGTASTKGIDPQACVARIIDKLVLLEGLYDAFYQRSRFCIRSPVKRLRALDALPQHPTHPVFAGWPAL